MAAFVRHSNNKEKDFIEAALHHDLRVDGRHPLDSRPLRINFFGKDGTVEVLQGKTRILAVVGAQLCAPSPDYPTEGSLAVFTEFSPMADPNFEPGRPRESAVELGRVIDRGLRESKALDTESLCVLKGEKVWALRLDLHVLDNNGNMLDPSNVAALAALLAFQISESNNVEAIESQEKVIHAAKILDPNLYEEAAMEGRLTLTLNAHGEICAIQKAGGVGLTINEIINCLYIARTQVSNVTDIIERAVETHNEERRKKKFSQYWNAGQTAASLGDNELLDGTRKEHILTCSLDECCFVDMGPRTTKSKILNDECSDEDIYDISDEDADEDPHLREFSNHLSSECVLKRQLMRVTEASSLNLDTLTLSPPDGEAMEEFRAVAEVLADDAASHIRLSGTEVMVNESRNAATSFRKINILQPSQRRLPGTEVLVKESHNVAASSREVNVLHSQASPQTGTLVCNPALETLRQEHQSSVVKSYNANALVYQDSYQKLSLAATQKMGDKPSSLLDAVKRKPKK